MPSILSRPDGGITGGIVAGFAGRVRTGTAGDPSDYANVYYECIQGGVTADVAPTYPTTVGSTITDGTAVFIVRDAWLRYAKVSGLTADGYGFGLDRLPDPRASVDDWYTLGQVFNRSEPNVGVVADIAGWVASVYVVKLLIPVQGFFNVGDWVEIARGCQKTETACGFYNNLLNRMAETEAPGRDLALTSVIK
jgi:hypothetical protein